MDYREATHREGAERLVGTVVGDQVADDVLDEVVVIKLRSE